MKINVEEFDISMLDNGEYEYDENTILDAISQGKNEIVSFIVIDGARKTIDTNKMFDNLHSAIRKGNDSQKSQILKEIIK